MSYYWFNRQELQQKPKNIYHTCGGKEKATEYYIANKDFIKEYKKLYKKYKKVYIKSIKKCIKTCQKKKKAIYIAKINKKA